MSKRIGAFVVDGVGSAVSNVIVPVVSAILAIAADHGLSALVRAASHNDQLGAGAGDLIRALLSSEARIDERFDAIDRHLEDVLNQRFDVEMAIASRLFLDASASPLGQRRIDLEQARAHLTQASASARSDMQRAVAERELIFAHLLLGRQDLADVALANFEAAALSVVLDARSTPTSTQAALRLMRHEGISATGWGANERKAVAQRRANSLAVEMALAGGVFLREAAALAVALNLPPRNVAGIPETVDDRFPWQFRLSGDAPIKLGPITAQFRWAERSAQAPPVTGVALFPVGGSAQSAAVGASSAHRPTHLSLQIQPALRRPLWAFVGSHGEPISSLETQASVRVAGRERAEASVAVVRLGFQATDLAGTTPRGVAGISLIAF